MINLLGISIPALDLLLKESILRQKSFGLIKFSYKITLDFVLQ